jgi:hypothetical protein
VIWLVTYHPTALLRLEQACAMEDDNDVELPNLDSSVLEDRDYIELILRRNIVSCLRGNDLDEERAAHFLRDAVKKMFDLQLSAYKQYRRYDNSWIIEIASVSVNRVVDIAPRKSNAYFAKTQKLLITTLVDHVEDSLSPKEFAAAFPEIYESRKTASPSIAASSLHPPQETLVQERAALLEAYKDKTGASNRQIYTASNSGIHKPQFSQWRRGLLPSTSATTINFERFLRNLKPPRPREPNS